MVSYLSCSLLQASGAFRLRCVHASAGPSPVAAACATMTHLAFVVVAVQCFGSFLMHARRSWWSPATGHRCDRHVMLLHQQSSVHWLLGSAMHTFQPGNLQCRSVTPAVPYSVHADQVDGLPRALLANTQPVTPATLLTGLSGTSGVQVLWSHKCWSEQHEAMLTKRMSCVPQTESSNQLVGASSQDVHCT
jgi:hypothetical protein